MLSWVPAQVETWSAENAETIELPEQEEQQFAPRVDDTFARLEKGEADKLKAKELNSRVAELYYDSNEKFKNDYQLNKDLRRQNRCVTAPTWSSLINEIQSVLRFLVNVRAKL